MFYLFSSAYPEFSEYVSPLSLYIFLSVYMCVSCGVFGLRD